MEIYIRPLKEEDAIISYKWRNDPVIWKYTGKKPDKHITKEIEQNWIKKVLKKRDEKRFAICLSKNNQYIGNVQLTHIENAKARFHIFIGEKSFWGKGIATKATKLILKYAFNELKIKEIYLLVNRENHAAIKAYEKSGFKIIKEEEKNYIMKIFNNV